ncbi:polymer-forming cytoskeletal protein [Sneathiella sp. P13V-1]|uniref:bactofilin family protein n=1 Tax=Sneathiella sp. P13V-1 TaxID=2697366 RepID=UPI00187B13EF|nr:polymer-forming cytoskeletal protein [Sneathiella sp. P13V-1]MBE7637020.1 polymer-forming cytoskeletal protein [Sneathiella sp. P13V-1]
MFSSGNDKKNMSSDTMPSIIAKGLVVTGDLISDGEVQIDGIVKGNIQATTITIGETSHVTGDVDADNVTIRGKVDGNITGCNVAISATASVKGDVTNSSLQIEPGAKIDGHCRHSDTPRENPDLVINFAESAEAAAEK